MHIQDGQGAKATAMESAILMLSSAVKLDLLIVGAGFSGLWLLNRACREGYSALLIESDRIGSGQSIHGHGFIVAHPTVGPWTPTEAQAQQVSTLVSRWREMCAGSGEIDLRRVRILSEQPLRWQLPVLANSGFSLRRWLGLRRRHEPAVVERSGLADAELPASWHSEQRGGHMDRLDGFVIDNRSLLEALVWPVRPYILHSRGPVVLAGDGSVNLRVDGRDPVVLQAQRTVFTAGTGSALLGSVPLHIWQQSLVMLRGGQLPDDVFVNAVDDSGRRRFNVTSHRDAEGRVVWYLGGGNSDVSSTVDGEEQIEQVRGEIERYMPWVSLAGTESACISVQRAAARLRDAIAVLPVVKQIDGFITAWSANVATAPLLADEVMELLRADGLHPSAADLRAVDGWPAPELAAAPWDNVKSWLA